MSADELTSIRESLHRIELAVTGDSAVGHKGLAQRMEEAEAKIACSERRLLVWSGIATGAAVIITHLKLKLFG